MYLDETTIDRDVQMKINDIYKYSILEEFGLVIQYHENDITYEGIKQLKFDILSDKAYKSDFVFIIDIRKAKTTLTKDELTEYGNWVASNLELNDLSRHVLLTSNPEQVVKTTMYLMNKNISLFQYKICSTLDAALYWLNIDTSFYNTIKGEIEKLQQSSLLE